MIIHPDATPPSESRLPQKCPECEGRKEGFQIYTARIDDRTLLAWDVELAWKICSDGRNPVQLHRTYLDEVLRVNHFNPLHLEHVDPEQPGIACVVDYTEDMSPVLCLIDGSHRAAVCQRDGKPFFVYMLSPEESVRCQHTFKVALYRAMVRSHSG